MGEEKLAEFLARLVDRVPTPGVAVRQEIRT